MPQSGNIPTTGGIICRLLRLPEDNPEIIAAFTGALLPLIDPDVWDDRFGTLTAEAAAKLAKDIINEMLESDECMIGQVKMFARDTLPNGVLLCDGSAYLRADYPRLYDVLPSSLIVDGSMFRVPDMRDRFALAAGSDYQLTDIGGSQTHTLTANELPSHSHTAQPHSHTSPPHAHTVDVPQLGIDIEGPGAPDPTAVGNPPIPRVTTATAVQISTEIVTIDSTGGDASHNNMPPYYTLVFGIQAR